MSGKTRVQLISETTDCDYKAVVRSSKPKSWLKSVSAFANTAGASTMASKLMRFLNESRWPTGL